MDDYMDLKPIKIVVYHCTNLKLFKNSEHKTYARSQPGLSLVAIPCSGKMEAHHLLNTLAGGASGVLVLGCAQKACQYLEGSKRSNKRAEFARSWLKKVDIEPDRIQFVNIPPMDLKALDKTIEDFTSLIKSYGSIPPVANNQVA
jgi:F420-non-reducing hydrogenase iron-sulfur subunit